ncbi:TRAFAC clade GTPase domain-containing protein [Micromonospora sp. DT48]|uniref:TRAFAC clade GTPase domain-containing protein n=1 Tax=Micromonospora sp. DT48 TaxID=3393429 RepID=UPI003CEB38A9
MRLIGRVLHFTVSVSLLFLVALPLANLTAITGLAAGIVLVLGVAAVVLVGRPTWVRVRTPDDVHGGALAGRVAPAFVRWDRAWPQYFAAQVLLDAQALARRVWLITRQLWARPRQWARAHRVRFWWPFYLPVLAVQVGATLGVVAGVLGAGLVTAGVSIVVWLVGILVVLLLRGMDAGWQFALGARASCRNCHQLAAVPAYRCQGPHPLSHRLADTDLHRDLRPGRLGVLWRRCGCGVLLPTTVLRAAFSRRLQACCPSCGEPLLPGAGVVTDVRLPVFGAASAGKTQLIMSALAGLELAAKQAGVEVSLADEHSRQRHETYSRLMREGASPAKTEASGQPVAITLRLARGPRVALVHLFDAAGENLVDREQNARLAYLDHARSLIYVLDPFSVRRVREEFASGAPEIFAAANPASHDPEDAYNATAQRLQEYGVRTDRKRLALVVSKADLLKKMSAGPKNSAGVRAWLRDNGLSNLVLSAERDFREVRFYLVSGRDSGPDGGFGPANWILGREWSELD